MGNIEIAEQDFPDHMKWNDAKRTCNKLGDRWRLPTKDELNDMFLNKDKIGGFSSEELDYYWSSTKYYGYIAWYQDFRDGSQDGFNKSFKFRVRAVRFFN